MTVAIQASADTRYSPAKKPTLYFIGMTTGSSAIMNVFPHWAERLGLGDVSIQGIDCKWHDHPDVYRRAVEFIKNDPLSCGALVTTHKIDLLNACRPLFDELDPYAELMGQVCCISKSGNKLRGIATDPITSALAMEAFLPRGYWEETGGEVLCMGAGGASISITSQLIESKQGSNRPRRIVVTNRSPERLEKIKLVHKKLGHPVPLEYRQTSRPEENDALLGQLPPRSLVINATGLGKDAPGSPLTGQTRFPEEAFAWDLNYRGNLVFLDQAHAQAQARHLSVQDGWIYFIHGWTRVIAEVFGADIPTRGPVFDELSAIAARLR
jgi:shikimate 5-dehydrogenase